MRISGKCLCQDCLRVVPGFFDANEEAECMNCGGDLCDCAGCLETISLLESGQRDPRELGLLPGVALKSWTPQGGAVPA